MHNLTSFGAILSSPLMLQAESLRQPFPPPAQLAEVEAREPPVQAPNKPATQPMEIEIKPSPQIPESLHDKVVPKAIRATRDKLLEKYGPVAVATLLYVC